MPKRSDQLGLFGEIPQGRAGERGTPVPITSAILSWAIEESGYAPHEVVDHLGVSSDLFASWLEGRALPNLTQSRRLAAFLKRPLAAFLLPKPPILPRPEVEFRRPFDSDRTTLNPQERLHLREAQRIQRGLSWTLKELGLSSEPSRKVGLASNPETIGRQIRNRLGITEEKQFAWSSSASAFQNWRAALENLNIFVFLMPLGRSSCRGFSLWDERASIITINTWWNYEARIFTMFHEYGHLLTRTNSACIGAGSLAFSSSDDSTERWCESFSAATLIPWEAVVGVLEREFAWSPGTPVRTLAIPQRLARRFKVSLRAATLRLIQRDVATSELYKQIPPASDEKRAGGGGGGRNRSQIREDRYGGKAADLFLSAIKSEVLSRADVLSYLDVADANLDQLGHPPMSG